MTLYLLPLILHKGIIEQLMDTKRFILAMSLSVVIFIGWHFLSLKMGWIVPPQQGINATSPGSSQTAATPASVQPQTPGMESGAAASTAFFPKTGKTVTVETPLYRAVFHSQGGVLREFSLKKYRQDIGPTASLVNLISETAATRAPLGLIIDGASSWTVDTWTLDGGNLNLKEGETGKLRFTGVVGGVTVARVLTFTANTYTIDEAIDTTVQEARNVRLALSFDASHLAVEDNPSIIQTIRYLVFGGQPPPPGEIQHNVTRVAWVNEGKFSEDTSTSDLAPGKELGPKTLWAGIMSNYFLGAISMPGADAKGSAQFSNGVFQVFLGKTLALESAKTSTLAATYYLGPKDVTALRAAPNQIEKALDYGIFSIIAKPLVLLLGFFYGYAHNYGIAIILLTVLIKLLFWPLSQKSYKSMDQMKKLQPLMAKIREKHADDKETMNKEIMQLYKTYKVNPAGGCLPILVQIPVFFGLYQALLNAIELRQAPFIFHLPFTDYIWLADLSSRDPFLISPLIMGASMFLQQKLTPTPGDPTQAKVMLFMPLIFTVLFITFPSGLVLYWLVNNVISIAQQWWMLRRS